jgi:D-serine deaminase-like pyridoxal phosphate-dependent protein
MTEQLFTFCSSSFELPCSLKDLPTPCLLVDEDVVRSNCESMLQKAAQARVYLRPHVKTHKCREIALMQVGGDKSNGIIASTLPEVRYMAADGFTDITYAVPVSESKLLPLLKICKDYPATRVSILIDSEEQLEYIAALSADPAAAPIIGMGQETKALYETA